MLLLFSHSAVSDSLRPHGVQHARPPCPLQTAEVYSNSRPSSWWCHPMISSSVVPFSSCPNLSQHQGLFKWVIHIRWPKYWHFSISPSNEHSGLISFRMDWLDLLAVHVTLGVVSNTTVQMHQFSGTQLSLQSNSHIHMWLLEKP